MMVAWGSVAGALLQIIVQLPQTLPLLGRIRLQFARVRASLRVVFSNLLPVVAGRGVGQLSGYIDNLLASLLPIGAVAAINYAQILYLLPISLFGMSVAAAELPTMSRATAAGKERTAETLRARLNSGLRQISFMVVPSAAAFLFIGDVIVSLLFQSGKFSHADARYVWGVLAGSSVGLLAATMGRLYNSSFYALSDTRTPLKFALVRVTLTLILGYLFAIPLPPLLGLAPKWGVAGLTTSAGLAAWVEFSLLRAQPQPPSRMDRVAASLSRPSMDHGADRVRRRTRHQILDSYRPAPDGSGRPARFRRGLFRHGLVDGHSRTRSRRRLRARPPPQLNSAAAAYLCDRASTVACYAWGNHSADHRLAGASRHVLAAGGWPLATGSSSRRRAIVEVVLCPSSSGASATRPPRASTKPCPSTCLPGVVFTLD